MKPHPRIRKTAKWGGAIATVLLVVVWLSSAWWDWFTPFEDATVNVGCGCIRLGCFGKERFHLGGRVGFMAHRCAFTFGGWEYFEFRNSVVVGGPLWVFVAPSLVITVVASRLDTLARRRAMLNLCTKCRYDRTGLPPQAPCPECGAAPTAVAPASR